MNLHKIREAAEKHTSRRGAFSAAATAPTVRSMAIKRSHARRRFFIAISSLIMLAEAGACGSRAVML